MSEVKDKELLLAKIKLLALIGVFGLPLLAAMILSHKYKDGMPDSIGTTNKGDLVHPVHPLPDFALTTPEGETLSKQDLQGKWTLVYISENGCAEVCQKQLDITYRVFLRLHKDAKHAQRLFIYGGLIPAEVKSVHESFPKMLMGTADADSLKQLANEFRVPGGLQGHDSLDRVYLLDGIGNVMMSYAVDSDPSGLLSDMKKLIKYTKIGN